MDLRLTEDELAFRDEVRAFVRDNLPASIREKSVAGPQAREGRLRPLDADPRRQGLGRAALAGRMGRDRMGSGQAGDLPRRNSARKRARRRSLSGSTWSGPSSTLSVRRRRRSGSCRASSICGTGGARASPSRAPAPTSRACAPPRGATATHGSFPARRPGPPWRSTPTGSSSSPAPTRRPRSRRASRSSWST